MGAPRIRATAPLLLPLALLRPAASDPVVAVAAGYSHSLFLKDSGTLYGVGHNLYGELADRQSSKRVRPIHMVDAVQAVAAGYYHSLMLLEDHRVLAAGDNSDGQLADSTNVDSSRAVEVMEDVQAIAAGGSHSLFLTDTWNLFSAGYNTFGQLADGTRSHRNTPVMVKGMPAVKVRAMAAGALHSLFLTDGGRVLAAGNNENGMLGSDTQDDAQTVPVQVTLSQSAKAVAAGAYHSLYLMEDGSVYAAGQNKLGQLGDGSLTDRSVPVKVEVYSVMAGVAGGFQHSLFLASEGGVWSVGANDHGQLGDGSRDSRKHPEPVEASGPVRAIAAGALHSIFLMQDGTVTTSGSNFWGQLGDGNPRTDEELPVNTLVPWDVTADEQEWIKSLHAHFQAFGGAVAGAAAFPSALACTAATAAVLLAVGMLGRRLGVARGSKVALLASEEDARASADEESVLSSPGGQRFHQRVESGSQDMMHGRR